MIDAGPDSQAIGLPIVVQRFLLRPAVTLLLRGMLPPDVVLLLSSTSLRQRVRRSGSSTPAATAPWTAQPGSWAWVQSLNRQRGGKLGDLGEQGLDAKSRIADTERAHSRRVNHPSTTCNGMKRARGCDVASLGIVFADLSGLLGQFLSWACQCVHQRRFADTGGSDQRNCMPHTAQWG